MPHSPHHLIATSGLFREMALAFFKVTGIRLKLLPVPCGDGMPHEPPCGHGCCELLACSPLGRAACHHTLSRLGAAAGPSQAQCAAALIELSMPVLAGGRRPFAMLVAGPVLDGKPPPCRFHHRVAGLRIDAAQSDWQRAEDDYQRTPVLAHDQRLALLQLLALLAAQLGDCATQAAPPAADHPEPRCVACAKHFVEQHLLDDVHTHDAARAAHMSLQHFCRVFHHATGRTFTDYLCRQRIEKARKLLTNPQLSITEVAFECGFRSLPWFDRIFKRHTGRSPSEYRGSPQPALFPQKR
jgi:AraC-like DNA-binding protein